MSSKTFIKEAQAFIFNWPRVSENAKVLQKDFSMLGVDTYVINSDEKEDKNALPNWINIGESGYMVKQFAAAIERFNKTYCIIIMADIFNVDASLIIERAAYVFSKYDCGVYAPNADYIAWVFDKAKIPRLEEYLYEVKNAETLLTCIHNDVLKELHLNPQKYRIGWGIDLLVAFLAHMKNKLVIRDYITTIGHPRRTDYSTDEADEEFHRFVSDLDEDTQLQVRQWINDAVNLLERDFREMLSDLGA